MGLVMISGPLSEPLTLDEARAFLKVEATDDDALIQSLVVSSRMEVEAASRRRLITQSWRIVLDRAPPGGIVRLGLSPVQSVIAVRSRDATGLATVLGAEAWQVDLASAPPRLRLLAIPATLTPAAMAAIEIDVVAGYGAALQVPEALRQAVRLVLSSRYELRGDPAGWTIPAPVAALLAPFRTLSL